VSVGKWIECAGRGNLRRRHTAVGTLRRRLADEAHRPAEIFTKPRIGYRLAGADARETNPPESLWRAADHCTWLPCEPNDRPSQPSAGPSRPMWSALSSRMKQSPEQKEC